MTLPEPNVTSIRCVVWIDNALCMHRLFQTISASVTTTIIIAIATNVATASAINW